MTVERGDGSGRVVFEDIAPEVLRFRAYPIIWEGLFLGVYDLAHKKPQLDFKLLRGERRWRLFPLVTASPTTGRSSGAQHLMRFISGS